MSPLARAALVLAAALAACRPAGPASRCARDSDCPPCHLCDQTMSFCFPVGGADGGCDAGQRQFTADAGQVDAASEDAASADACQAGVACTLPNLCLRGSTVCAPAAGCEATEPLAPGTACGVGSCDDAGICQGNGGEVVQLTAGAAYDHIGAAVAAQGDLAVLGAPDPYGECRVYLLARQPDGAWLESDHLLPAGSVAADKFGSAVVLDGDRMMIGASWYGPDNRGAVMVFERQGNGWVQTFVIQPADLGANEELGAAIDLQGNRAVVTASYADVDGSRGAAWVVERNADASWSAVATLSASGGDRLGFAADLDGDRIALGSLWEQNPGSDNEGAVHIFERAADGSWPETATLYASPTEPGEFTTAFGAAVLFDGERLFVGEQLYSSQELIDEGRISVYRRQADASWLLRSQLREEQPREWAQLGRGLAVMGGKLLATSVDLDSNDGRLSIFEELPGGAWRQVARLSRPEVGAWGGYAVGGIFADLRLAVTGSEVLVGYPDLPRGAEREVGGVVIYDLDGLW